MCDLPEINEQIKILNQKKEKLLSKEKEEYENLVKSLDWTKSCHAKLVIESMYAAGLQKYSIVMVNGDYPKPGFSDNQSITVMGKSRFYENNICYSQSYALQDMNRSMSFKTNNKNLLIEFLDEVKFKTLDYKQDDLDVLRAAERNSND